MPISIRPLFTLEITPDTAGAGSSDTVVTRPFSIVDGTVECRAAQASGTAQLLRQALGTGGFVAITDLVICAVDDVLTGVGTLANAETTTAITDVIRLTLVGSATDCLFHAYAFMRTIPGT